MGGLGKRLGKALKRYTPAGQAYSGFKLATGHKSALNDIVGGGLAPGGVAGGTAIAGSMDAQQARTEAEAARRMVSASGGTVGKALPGGMANFYDDSWKQLLGGGNVEDNLLNV